MRKRCYAIGCAISVLAACGNDASPVAPSGPARATETFALTTTVLLRDGGMSYPSGTAIRTIAVNQTGLIEARVSPGGPGPELAFQGTVTADTYQLGLVARSGGVSLCGVLPFDGVPLAHTIVATYPR